MLLSKKWILSIIGITAVSFMILLVIQFGWIRKSIDVNRRHFADRMVVVSNNIRDAFLMDRTLYEQCLSGNVHREDLFLSTGEIRPLRFEGIIKHKLDSVLTAQQVPVSTQVEARVDTSCYYMKYVDPALRSSGLDHSVYKICLCTNNYRGSLDIGFDLSSDSLLVRDSSGLILPSVVLILLLISLFAYLIYVMNRQKKLAELKNDFINNLTHEFNTPIFSIGLTTTLLSRSEPIHKTEKLKGYVDLIITEKNRLQTQVNKILRLTEVESGSGILEKEKLDIHLLIEENLKVFSPMIREKGGSVRFEPAAADHFTDGDPVHLFNAISNLIDNAIKYSIRPPEILIATRNENGHLIIQIRDNGIGMSKTEAQMIFDKFYRIKQGDRHDVKGFGIGLSYVKKIMELHGGSVNVNSATGEGSLFTIQLPIVS